MSNIKSQVLQLDLDMPPFTTRPCYFHPTFATVGEVTGDLWLPVPSAMIPGTMPRILYDTTPDNLEERSAEKIVFGWH